MITIFSCAFFGLLNNFSDIFIVFLKVHSQFRIVKENLIPNFLLDHNSFLREKFLKTVNGDEITTISQKLKARFLGVRRKNLVIVTANCHELGILHDTSFVEIKIFNLSTGRQGLVRNDAHKSEHSIERNTFLMGNPVSVIQQSGFEEEVSPGKVSKFHLAFLQQALIWTVDGSVTFDPSII